MPKIFVESTSNHPYGDRMRLKGTRYEIEDADLDLMVKLKRVRALDADESQKERGSQAYLTRDMNAARIMTSLNSSEPQKPAEAPKPARSRRGSQAPAAPDAPPAPASDDDK